MTEKELKEEIKRGPTGGYLLYGDEDYLKRFYLSALTDAALRDCPDGLCDFNRISLTLEDGDFSALGSALLSPPVMAPKKCIILTPPCVNAWKEKERRAFAEILEMLPDAPDTVLILSCARDTLDAGGDKRPSALFKLLTKHLSPVPFPLQSGAKLQRWALRHFAEEGIAISEEDCAYLLGRCAPDMTTLVGEIDKVICYVKAHGRESATAEDVALVTSPGIREDAFALANAVLAGDRTAALSALDILKKRKEDPIAVLGTLSRVMSDLVTVATLAEEGADRGEIAKMMKMHEYKAGLYLNAAAGFGKKRLSAALDRCLAADRLSKTASMGYIPLERFVATIPLGKSGGRKNG